MAASTGNPDPLGRDNVHWPGDFYVELARQLIWGGQAEEARLEFTKIRRQVDEEFALMRVQIDFEMQREITSCKEIFRLFWHLALVLGICARTLGLC